MVFASWYNKAGIMKCENTWKEEGKGDLHAIMADIRQFLVSLLKSLFLRFNHNHNTF